MKHSFISLGWAFVLLAGWATTLRAQGLSTETTPSTNAVYTLSGRILEKGNKSPVLGGTLFLEPTGNTLITQSTTLTPAKPLSADADLNGNYSVSVPAGPYRLIAAGEGFKKITLAFFSIQKDTHKDFYLERDGFTLPEVVVTTQKIPKTQVSQETLSKEELTEVPGTQEDVLKALQALPGVITAGSLDGQLLVRGSGPDDNLYFVDNVPIAFPYHFGIISTLDSNLIKGIDFYSGGFGPQFPNAMGGLVDLTQRDPRSDHWGFRADVNLFLSEFEVEGPITSNSSLAVAGRRSYLDVFVKDFSGNTGDIEVPVFDDYQVKYSYNPSPKVHWDFVAFGSDDTVSGSLSASSTVAAQDPVLAGAFNFNDGYNSQGINYRDTTDSENIIANTLYRTHMYFNLLLGQGFYDNSTSDDIGNKFSWNHEFDVDTTLEGGLQYDHFINWTNAYIFVTPTSDPEGFNPSTVPSIRSQNTVQEDDFSAYLDQKFKALDQRLSVSAGARLDYVNSDETFLLAPRVSAAYQLYPATTLKGSWGYYYEAPDRIFTESYLDPSLGNPHLGAQLSDAAVLGLEQKLDESGLLFRVEGYEKDLSQLIVYDPEPGVNYTNGGTGTAHGVEFFLRQPPTERFFGWIAYSLSSSVRQDSPVSAVHPFDYDEPNVITAVANYKINPGWDAGVKVLYNTGHPYTPESEGVTVPEMINNQPVTTNGVPVSLITAKIDSLDSARLPDYLRVDFSTSIKTVYDTWEWKVYLDAYNLLGTKNVLGYRYNTNYSQPTPVYDLPFLPYLGFEVKY
jgi:hypothetical protein